MVHAAERGWVWCSRRQGAVRVVDCQCQTANLAAEAGRDLWTHLAGTDAESVDVVSDSDKLLGGIECKSILDLNI